MHDIKFEVSYICVALDCVCIYIFIYIYMYITTLRIGFIINYGFFVLHNVELCSFYKLYLSIFYMVFIAQIMYLYMLYIIYMYYVAYSNEVRR